MTRHRRFDLIAFDWDGTLFDSTGLIVRCIQAACRDVGTAVPGDGQAAYVIGLGLMDALRHAAPDLLQSLKARNHWLAVATGKSRPGLNEALDSAQLRPLFDATRTADETASKPDPLMLLELMSELGAEPQRTLMIGDTTHDLQLAANAGVASVAVSYGAHPSEDFQRHAPLFVAHSTRELQGWLHEHA
jgi:phosphoglycolate phosphatase